MVAQLIFALEPFITDLTVKLALVLFLLPQVMMVSYIVCEVLLSVILFDFSETFLFKTLLDVLLLFFFSFLLFFFLYLFLLFALFLLLEAIKIVDETWITLADIAEQIFDGFYISLLLALPLFLILFLHLAPLPAVASFTRIPFFAPHKCLVCHKVLPVLVKLKHSIFGSVGVTKAFIFALIFVDIFTQGVGLGLFGFNLLEDIAVYCIEAPLAIFITFEASCCEVIPNVKTESELIQVFLAHILLVEQ